MFGAYITIAGAIITIVLNIWWIPIFHYSGSAWATLICYSFMMVISYTEGQKHYPIPYPKKKLLSYLGVSVLLYVMHEVIARNVNAEWSGYNLIYYGSGLLFMLLFLLLIIRVEAKELQRLPVVGRYFYRAA
jgi:O-antigen/teichoic acid export membrane protein